MAVSLQATRSRVIPRYLSVTVLCRGTIPLARSNQGWIGLRRSAAACQLSKRHRHVAEILVDKIHAACTAESDCWKHDVLLTKTKLLLGFLT